MKGSVTPKTNFPYNKQKKCIQCHRNGVLNLVDSKIMQKKKIKKTRKNNNE